MERRTARVRVYYVVGERPEAAPLARLSPSELAELRMHAVDGHLPRERGERRDVAKFFSAEDAVTHADRLSTTSGERYCVEERGEDAFAQHPVHADAVESALSIQIRDY
jgi:hypothetical protein